MKHMMWGLLLCGAAHADEPIYKMAGAVYKNNVFVAFAQIHEDGDPNYHSMQECRWHLQMKVASLKNSVLPKNEKILGMCIPIPEIAPPGT